MLTERDFEINDLIIGMDYIDDPDVYNMIKDTWIERRIEQLSNLRTFLIEKKKNRKWTSLDCSRIVHLAPAFLG